MAAVTISIILILLMYGIFDKVQTVFVVGQNRARAMEEARAAMDMLKRDFESIDGAEPLGIQLRGRARMPVGEVLNPFFVQTSFTSEDDGYRLVEYMFGGRNTYEVAGLPTDSPVGAIWLWRSPVVVSKSQLSEKKAIHASHWLSRCCPPRCFQRLHRWLVQRRPVPRWISLGQFGHCR